MDHCHFDAKLFTMAYIIPDCAIKSCATEILCNDYLDW
jgi:hypothetical protein